MLRVGSINRPIFFRFIYSTIFLLLMFCPTIALAATYTVINTNDSGAGSLRQAITDANDNPGIDTIDFDATLGGGTITLLTNLPDLSDDTVVDGTTANDVQPGPDITIVGDPAFYSTLGFVNASASVIKGIALTNSFECLTIGDSITGMTIGGTGARDGNTVDGCTHGISLEYCNNVNVYNNIAGKTVGNATSGINVFGCNNVVVGGSEVNKRNIFVNNDVGIHIGGGASNVTIIGNYIGTENGTDAAGNIIAGISTEDNISNITIGGTAAGERNIISGNDGVGVAIGRSIEANMVVKGNYIGVTADGTAALANNGEGIRASGYVTIGGTEEGAGNIISGNTTLGIRISDQGNCTVQGNIIGLNAEGTAVIPNGIDGMSVVSPDNLIGGTIEGARNIISGNTQEGIVLDGSDAVNNIVEMNYIGLNPAGTAAFPNGRHGVYLFNGPTNNQIGVAGYGNVVSGNGNAGIRVDSLTTTDNSIQGNIIGLAADGTMPVGNTGAGIVLFQSSETIIGTANEPTARNIISGNFQEGIILDNTENNIIVNNYIGLATDGITQRTNAQNAISLVNFSQLNTIGGTETDESNKIASFGGGRSCIIMDNATGHYNQFRANDCVTEGVSENIDRVGTGNENIADPTITAETATTSYVEGTSVASGAIDIFADGIYKGSTTSNSSGDWSKNISLPSGGKVSVSVTNSNNSTSRTTALVVIADDEEVPAAPTVTSPVNGTAVSAETINISGTKPAYTSVSINDVEVVANDALTTWTANDVALVEGLNNFDIITTDLSDNPSDIYSYAITRKAGITVTETGGTTTVTEADTTDSFTVVLQSQPQTSVAIQLTYPSAQLSLSSTGSSATTSNSITITFTTANWNTAKTVRVSAVDDFSVEGAHTADISHTITTSDPAYAALTIDNISVGITDNDTAGMTLTESNGYTELTSSTDTDTYTVKLTSKPSQNVTISIVPDAELLTDKSSLVFTRNNWNTTQTVTVSLTDSTTATEALISHTATSLDANYNGLVIDDIVVNIDPNAENTPTANAGNDQTITVNTNITLDGSESTGQELSHLWEIVSGEGTLSDEESSLTTFTAGTTPGNVRIRLTVTDVNEQSHSDTVIIHVVNTVAKKKTMSIPLIGSIEGSSLYETKVMGETYLSTGSTKIKISQTSDSLGLDGEFEYAVAISQEGTLIIGKPHNNNNGGEIFYSTVPIAQLYGTFDLDDIMSLGVFEAQAGENENDLYGTYLATGDINNDGYDEIIVGAPGADNYGQAYVYNHNMELISIIVGSQAQPVYSILVSNFLGSDTEDILLGPNNKALNYNLQNYAAPENADLTNTTLLLSGTENFESSIDLNLTQADLTVGDGDLDYQSAAFGDVNHDHKSDLILVTKEGELDIYFGQISSDTDFLSDDTDVHITPANHTIGLGQSVMTGDVTGDGIDDIIVGAPEYGSTLTGAVIVIFGRTNWSEEIDLDSETGTVVLTGENADDEIGTDLFLGDVDENGIKEMYTLKSDNSVYQLKLDAETPAELSYNLSGHNVSCQLKTYNTGKDKKQQPFLIATLLLIVLYLITGMYHKGKP